ncbi:hypothetical protein Lalb_Chr18g0052381 [Lupinus albus]|uniref:Uncharacterized protein n=1 Tax=Lupinus albus TaxID=3870 RepID=A0A6A4NQ67_LUPAL|nr:hypothetical protein Lalb_Chr18g0052381 [Lupinus albus]
MHDSPLSDFNLTGSPSSLAFIRPECIPLALLEVNPLYLVVFSICMTLFV